MMQKYTLEAELALNKYCFETISLAASLKKGGDIPLWRNGSAEGSNPSSVWVQILVGVPIY